MTAPPYRGRSAARSRSVAPLLLGAVGLAGAAALARRRVVFRVRVEGVSMVPELAPGDRVIAIRTPVLAVGDLVALSDPEAPERLLVKRVSKLSAETIEVLGDNSEASRDSRQFGAVSRRAVRGRVVARYFPEHHAGLLRRPGRASG